LQTEVKILPTEEFLEQNRATMVDVIMTENKKKLSTIIIRNKMTFRKTPETMEGFAL